MLMNIPSQNVDLLSEKNRVAALLPEEYKQYISPNDEVLELKYPVLNYPIKVTSVGFEKNPDIKLPLTGIRGQYFLFEGGAVINIRKHSGFEVELIA